MGLLTEAIADLMAFRNVVQTQWSPVPRWQSGRTAFPDSKYETYAREGYQKNEIVFACIEELSTSAAEPEMMVRVRGEWEHEHRLLTLLDRPNPFMDHFEFWATVIMHRALAGNAYALKVRSRSGLVRELWLLRPDRVRIVPSSENFIGKYEFHMGDIEPIDLRTEDVIHFKTRHPLSDFYGMPPLMAIAGRVDIDNFMSEFVKTYFEKAGVPAGLLSTKQKMDELLKKEIKQRFSSEYGGGNWHGLMVLDGADATFSQMTAGLGTQGLVVPELNEISESRIAMAFGVPLSLIGALSGAGNSSYGNKKSERESFWNETLKPLYRELVGPLNIRLVPDFPGVEQVAFDLSTVGALQEDADAVHARVRNDYLSGVLTFQQASDKLGYEPDADGTLLVPANMTPVRVSELLAPRVVPETEPLPTPVPSGNGTRGGA